MSSRSIVANAVLAMAALWVVSGPAMARLDGTDREAFIKSSFESCNTDVRKHNRKMPAKQVKAYCSCIAEAEADMTTAADVQYMFAHEATTEDYKARVRALTPACNAKAGIK